MKHIRTTATHPTRRNTSVPPKHIRIGSPARQQGDDSEYTIKKSTPRNVAPSQSVSRVWRKNNEKDNRNSTPDADGVNHRACVRPRTAAPIAAPGTGPSGFVDRTLSRSPASANFGGRYVSQRYSRCRPLGR